jgi:hypothetical protein
MKNDRNATLSAAVRAIASGVTLAAAGAVTLLLPSPARAQGAPPPPLPAPAPAPQPSPPAAQPPEPAPPPPTVTHTVTPPAPLAPAESPETAPARKGDDGAPDHVRFVHHVGLMYFNVTALPIANPVAVTGPSAPQPGPGVITGSTVSAPVVGVRYWLKDTVGIDVGLGLGFGGGSQEAVSNGTDTKVDKPSATGFALHGGLPVALYQGRHYSFLVIPQFTVGVAGGTFKPGGGAPDQDLSGFLFDIGAQTGAEIHFGFIGVPELALQATIGLSYRRTAFKWKSDVNSASEGTDAFGTNVQADPWAIFTNNIAATYYF